MKKRLHALISQLNIQDIHNLCTELHVDFRELVGKGPASKSWSLLNVLEDEDRLYDLLTHLHRTYNFMLDTKQESDEASRQLANVNNNNAVPSSFSQNAKGNFIFQAINGQILLNLRQVFGYSTADEQGKRNLNMLLHKVQMFWIKGRPQLSLHNMPIMELDLIEHPLLVENQNRHLPDSKTNREGWLSHGRRLITVFDHIGQTFLLLGEPGAGKTTLLIQFVEDLIQRNRTESFEPVPVLLNLSSWAKEKRLFSEWLVDVLNEFYRIPRRIAQTWIDQDALMFILDGLDEMALEHQAECVRAINEFLSHHMVKLIVSSRLSDYQSYAEQLKLDTAVVIAPLTQSQIDKFLEGVGDEFTTAKQMLYQDISLRKITTTPLMLSIVLIAYSDLSKDQLGRLLMVDDRRRYIFNVYVAKMYSRRMRDADYDFQKTLDTLIWFAKKMKIFNQNVLLIEKLSPDWLETPSEQRTYDWIVGTFGAVLGGLAGIYSGWGIAIMVGSLLFLLTNSTTWISIIMPISVFLLTTLGANYGWRNAVAVKEVKLVEKLVWSWEAVSAVLSQFPPFGKGRLWVALYNGIQGGEIPIKAEPNQGIKLSARNAGLVIVTVTVLVLIFTASIESLITSLTMLPLGIILGVFLSLRLGLFTVVQHYAIRFALSLRNDTLWNCIHFLDFAVDRIYLFRLGGGYIFIHRLLLEHMANLTSADIAQIKKYRGIDRRFPNYISTQISDTSKEASMDIVTTAIVSALATGTVAGISEISKNVITNAYNGLVKLIKHKFGEQSNVSTAISELEKKPDSKGRQEVLREEIESSNVYKDAEIESTAKTLIEKINEISHSEPHMQQAIGNFIAIADRGSTAKVEINTRQTD